MPPNLPLPAAAKPTRPQFDPWNSSSTGHQRAENRLSGSTSWRESRTAKLRSQFRDATGHGGARLADSVGAGSENFGVDGRLENGGWERGASGLRGIGQRSITEAFGIRKPVSGSGTGTLKSATLKEDAGYGKQTQRMGDEKKINHHYSMGSQIDTTSQLANSNLDTQNDETHLTTTPKTEIFSGLVFYVNGSTYPTISDYKLKQLIATNGGNLSLSLGRRTVTHVILGRANGGPGRGFGSGGGLASSKIQKELATIRGKGVKFVRAEWLVECVKAGKRVSEIGFGGLDLGRMRSVVGHLQAR